jgi:acetyl-CoA synthetase
MTGAEQIFLVTQAWKRRAWMDPDAYRKAYQRSLRDPEGFCAEQAMRLDWPNSRSAPP